MGLLLARLGWLDALVNSLTLSYHCWSLRKFPGLTARQIKFRVALKESGRICTHARVLCLLFQSPGGSSFKTFLRADMWVCTDCGP